MTHPTSSAVSSTLRAFRHDAGVPPHVLVAVAHPDDEVIGAGVLLQRLARRGGAIELLHATDGSPRDLRDARANGFQDRAAYARARRLELRRALQAGGLVPLRFHTLGVADQEATLAIPSLTRQLAGILARSRPHIVVTHPYEGGHPDHDALAFAVLAATRLTTNPPAVVELTSYHAGADGLRAGWFLPVEDDDPPVVMLDPTEQERDTKRAMLDCFATQADTIRYFPIGAERFRDQPSYDFGRPPHDGRLFYEQFDWGMSAAEWRRRAQDAAVRLGVQSGAAPCR